MTEEQKPTGLALLRQPFPEHQISKLPKPTKAQTEEVKADFKKGIRCDLCGTWHHPKVVHLDYVGHAALTDRLLDADPAWAWEPLTTDSNGLPLLDKDGGLWIKLTVCGVTRLGYGDAEGKTGGNATKERIGDALRNAAMRFGAALDLWHKGDLHPDEEEAKPEAARAEPPKPGNWAIDELEEFEVTLERAYSAFKQGGKPEAYDAFAKKWKTRKSEPAEPVLTQMAAFVAKLEDATAKSAAKATEDAAA